MSQDGPIYSRPTLQRRPPNQEPNHIEVFVVNHNPPDEIPPSYDYYYAQPAKPLRERDRPNYLPTNSIPPEPRPQYAASPRRGVPREQPPQPAQVLIAEREPGPTLERNEFQSLPKPPKKTIVAASSPKTPPPQRTPEQLAAPSPVIQYKVPPPHDPGYYTIRPKNAGNPMMDSMQYVFAAPPFRWMRVDPTVAPTWQFAVAYAALFLSFASTPLFIGQAVQGIGWYGESLYITAFRHATHLTPTSSTYEVWIPISILSAVWIIYCGTWYCRPKFRDSGLELIPIFWLFAAACWLVNIWSLLFTADAMTWGAVSLGFAAFSVTIALAWTYCELKKTETGLTTTDWLLMNLFLVGQLSLAGGWLLFVAFVQLDMALVDTWKVDPHTSAVAVYTTFAALIIIFTLIDGYYALCRDVTTFGFGQYISWTIGSGGVYAALDTEDHMVIFNQFCLVVFIVCALLFILKVMWVVVWAIVVTIRWMRRNEEATTEV